VIDGSVNENEISFHLSNGSRIKYLLLQFNQEKGEINTAMIEDKTIKRQIVEASIVSLNNLNLVMVVWLKTQANFAHCQK
jgi:hypothetical protein